MDETQGRNEGGARGHWMKRKGGMKGEGGNEGGANGAWMGE